jgi:hypothetical protein
MGPRKELEERRRKRRRLDATATRGCSLGER